MLLLCQFKVRLPVSPSEYAKNTPVGTVIFPQLGQALQIRYLWNKDLRWFVHRRDSSVLELAYLNEQTIAVAARHNSSRGVDRGIID